MKSKGAVNIEISFPVILKVRDGYYVAQDKKRFTIFNDALINEINSKKYNEYIVDSHGNLYKFNAVDKLVYINIFWGFSLRSGGASNYYAAVNLEKISELSLKELKEIGFKILEFRSQYFLGTLLEINRWKIEFSNSENREDILRYLFYFTSTSHYYDPDHKDSKWRERIGFIKE